MQAELTLPVINVLDRATLYARVSGNDRGKEGRNLNGQLEMARKYAGDKGYSIVAEFAEDDRGASGYEINLPELNKIRDMARNGEFDVLVVRELDRLSRNLAKQLIVEEELRRAGVRIEYVIGEYEDTPEGRLNKHIRATIAEYEREKIKERMQRGKENASKAGKVLINVAPFGYELIDGQLVINDEEAKIIQLIYQLYINGGTLYGIARKLDKMGVIRQGKSNAARQKRDFKIGWTPDAIRRILTSKTYAGTFYYGKKKIPVPVKPIINKELFKVVQKRIKENRRVRTKRKYDYLLSGMCRCGKCRNSYVAYTSTYKDTIYPRYACAARRNPKTHSVGKCDAPILDVEIVDSLVWDWIRSLLLDRENLQIYLDQYNEKQAVLNEPIIRQIEITDALISENQAKLSKLLDAYLDGVFSRDGIVEKKASLETTISKLTTQRAELESRLNGKLLAQSEIKDILTLAEKVARGINKADESFESKRELVKMLQTEVIFTPLVDNGTEISISCILDNHELNYDDNLFSKMSRTPTGQSCHAPLAESGRVRC